MKGTAPRRAGLACLALVAAAAYGAPLRYLARDELLCAPARATCIRGSLTWQQNDRLLRLFGRVEVAGGRGTFLVTVTGTTRQGDRRYAPMEVELRGRPTEIVDFKMIPDYPEVTDWEVFSIAFTPAPPK